MFTVRRAMDQLDMVGKQVGVPVWVEKVRPTCSKSRLRAGTCRSLGANVVILIRRAASRIDEPLVQELVRLRDLVSRGNSPGIGWKRSEAVNVASHFDQALNITGAILTKLDGDARGGAALSLRKVTGKPIKFVGTGEKLDAFEPFHPERMASAFWEWATW